MKNAEAKMDANFCDQFCKRLASEFQKSVKQGTTCFLMISNESRKEHFIFPFLVIHFLGELFKFFQWI
jgi:hypothetical protein